MDEKFEKLNIPTQNKVGQIGMLHINNVLTTGEFWIEDYKSTILNSLLAQYKTDIIRTHGISDVVITNDKILIKWYCRHRPLTDEELLEKWGRDVNTETKTDG